jgi:uncharacterized protein
MNYMENAMHQSSVSDQEVLATTMRWLERAVIGLNLCPFAKGVHVKGQIQVSVVREQDPRALVEVIKRELIALSEADASVIDTCLLVTPGSFPNFFEFNRFVGKADTLIRKLKLQGVLQIAHFHPDFQFADTDADDISNFTNRAPYPIFHLLREDSISRAVASFPDPEMIYERNVRTLEVLGRSGWSALGIAPTSDNPKGVA